MEKNKVHEIIEQIINEQHHDVNMGSAVYRKDLADHLATTVNKHVNQMLEDILAPCGVNQQHVKVSSSR